jgi:hypothetical protein
MHHALRFFKRIRTISKVVSSQKEKKSHDKRQHRCREAILEFHVVLFSSLKSDSFLSGEKIIIYLIVGV